MRGLSNTHTVVQLEVSQMAYDEIRAKLVDADYEHTFMEDGGIDLSGIAIIPQAADPSWWGRFKKWYFLYRTTVRCARCGKRKIPCWNVDCPHHKN